MFRLTSDCNRYLSLAGTPIQVTMESNIVEACDETLSLHLFSLLQQVWNSERVQTDRNIYVQVSLYF